MVTIAEYDPEQEFHLSFSFSETFVLSKPVCLAQVSCSCAGFRSPPSGSLEELCPANIQPKTCRLPQLQPGQLLLCGITCNLSGTF